MQDQPRKVRFFREVRRLSRAENYWPFEVVALAELGDNDLVVIYRKENNGDLLGGFFEWDWMLRAFEDASIEAIAGTMVFDEIVDPSYDGAVFSFTWEKELTELDEPVLWHGVPPSSAFEGKVAKHD